MELLITAAIIIVLLILFGVAPMTIVMGVLWCMECILALMALFFLLSAVLLLSGRRVTGTFHHLEEGEGFAHAVYEVDGKTYPVLYPAEALLRKKIYHSGSHSLRIAKHFGNTFLFDCHSAHIIWLGLVCSAAGAAGLGYMLFLFHV